MQSHANHHHRRHRDWPFFRHPSSSAHPSGPHVHHDTEREARPWMVEQSSTSPDKPTAVPVSLAVGHLSVLVVRCALLQFCWTCPPSAVRSSRWSPQRQHRGRSPSAMSCRTQCPTSSNRSIGFPRDPSSIHHSHLAAHAIGTGQRQKHHCRYAITVLLTFPIHIVLFLLTVRHRGSTVGLARAGESNNRFPPSISQCSQIYDQ